MPRLIKNRAVVEDHWTLLPVDTHLSQALDCGYPIVPLELWQAHSGSLRNLPRLGVWLDSHELIEELADALDTFDLIALNFPAFTDGRPFSSARLLRERYAFSKEIRAIGDVLRDQLLMMQRCGFDAFLIRADRDPHDALRALDEFSVHYQGAWDIRQPLYRRRTAPAALL